MAKSRRIFICKSCGYESSKWLGKCPNCSAWNSFVEEEVVPDKSGAKRKPRTAPIPLKEVPRADESTRIRCGLEEFDRVLGGGIFPASVVLLAGEPGIGKSTLMLQVVMRLQQSKQKCLYVSAEESLQQLRDRAERLRPNTGDLLTLAETDVTTIDGCSCSI
ncbi:MAG: ATPase domain-containing protein [Calditrichota bacterium]